MIQTVPNNFDRAEYLARFHWTALGDFQFTELTDQLRDIEVVNFVPQHFTRIFKYQVRGLRFTYKFYWPNGARILTVLPVRYQDNRGLLARGFKEWEVLGAPIVMDFTEEKEQRGTLRPDQYGDWHRKAVERELYRVILLDLEQFIHILGLTQLEAVKQVNGLRELYLSVYGREYYESIFA